MGRKRKFIDKKNATVYHVLYRAAADANADPNGGEYETLSDAELFLQRAQAAHAAAQKHPLDWMRDKPEDYVTNEPTRNELYELGLPDDGYNYLQHLRVLTAGSGAVLRVDGASSSRVADAVKGAFSDPR
jgi:protein LTV1